MDDTAQTSSARPVQKPTDPSDQPVTQQQTSQQDTSQIQPPPGGGVHPEHGPLTGGLAPREATPVVNTETVAVSTDDQAAVPDEASGAVDSQKESVDVQVRESQPAVELSQEVKDAGVKEGEDAPKDKQPGEQLSVDKKPDQQTVVGARPPFTVPVPEEQAVADQKKAGIRDSLKWFAFLVIYQWKKLRFIQKQEEKKQ